MADSGNFGFGKLVPGFDFLQNLAKGATQSLPQMSTLSNWIAPTLNVEDLQKRIDELKTVQFWLEQNSKALGATIQALEVQKMTLSTLKGMNFSVGELAQAMQLKADAMKAAAVPAAPVAQAAEDPPAPAAKTPRRKAPARKPAADAAPAAATGVVDPMQWWGALSQQFQQIASNAMKDAATQTAMDATRNMASGLAKEALKTATGTAKAMAKTMGGAAASAATKAATSAASGAINAATGAARKATKAGAAKRARR